MNHRYTKRKTIMQQHYLDDMWTRIGSVTKSDVRIAVLKDEIELYKSRIQPHDTGYLHDAIANLTRRIEEIEKDVGYRK